MQTSITTTQLL